MKYRQGTYSTQINYINTESHISYEQSRYLQIYDINRK